MARIGHVLLVAGVLACAAVSPAFGDLTFGFTASIESLTDPGGLTNLGSELTGSYTFDETTPDAVGAAGIGSYELALVSFTLDLGDLGVITIDDMSTDPAGNVINVILGFDSYVVSAEGADTIGNEAGMNLLLEDTAAPVFADDSLPLAPPDPSLFNETLLELSFVPFGEPQNSIEVEATIDAINGTVIPAPGAALLGLLGLPLVGWVKRRAC